MSGGPGFRPWTALKASLAHIVIRLVSPNLYMASFLALRMPARRKFASLPGFMIIRCCLADLRSRCLVLGDSHVHCNSFEQKARTVNCSTWTSFVLPAHTLPGMFTRGDPGRSSIVLADTRQCIIQTV